MSMRWAERDPGRLDLEMRLLGAAAHGRFVRVGQSVAYEEEVVHDGVRFGFRIVFPDDYPYSPPRTHLLRPPLPVTSEIHRFVDGALCLFGPDEWHPNQTGLWVRNRTVAWIGALRNFSQTGAWSARAS